MTYEEVNKEFEAAMKNARKQGKKLLSSLDKLDKKLDNARLDEAQEAKKAIIEEIFANDRLVPVKM